MRRAPIKVRKKTGQTDRQTDGQADAELLQLRLLLDAASVLMTLDRHLGHADSSRPYLAG